MREELFEAIKAKLNKEVTDVKWIDLWNHNVEYIESEEGWTRPAVFVEICPIQWEAFTCRGMRGKGLVRLHVVTDWTEGGQSVAWGICRKIYEVINGMSGDEFNGMRLVETATNHNHEEILETIDSYEVRYLLS